MAARLNECPKINTDSSSQSSQVAHRPSTATGSVTYNVYLDSGCTTPVPGGGGSAETITTPGSLPASAPVTLSSAGTYFWGVSYADDSNNQASSSTCGPAGEVETVTSATTGPASTRLRTFLVGNDNRNGHEFRWEGRIVTVFAGASVTDTAKLSGSDAAQATGTVTYAVYTRQPVTKNGHRSWQWVAVANANAGTVTVTAGQVPNSNTLRLPAGVYEWQAVYSGDSRTNPPRAASAQNSRSSFRYSNAGPDSARTNRRTLTPPAHEDLGT